MRKTTILGPPGFVWKKQFSFAAGEIADLDKAVADKTAARNDENAANKVVVDAYLKTRNAANEAFESYDHELAQVDENAEESQKAGLQDLDLFDQ